jgi:hypothetical protein
MLTTLEGCSVLIHHFSYHQWTFSAVNIQGFLIEEVVWEFWGSNFCISQNSIHNISEHAGARVCFQDLELLWIWIQCHWLLLDFWRWVELRRITCCNTHQSNFLDVHCYFLYFLEWTLLPSWWTPMFFMGFSRIQLFCNIECMMQLLWQLVHSHSKFDSVLMTENHKWPALHNAFIHAQLS